MRHTRCLLLLSLLMFSGTLLAASLGEISAPLADRSAASVKAAEQAALTQLLVQLSGREDVSSLPGVSELVANPQQWLSQYGYGRAADGSQTLEAHFDAQALSHALLAAGAPVWSLSRPPLLLWVATPNGVLAANEGAVLSATADSRGLPLTLPANANEVAAADVRGRFMQPLFAASQTYGTDLVATAVIYQGSPAQMRWWLYQKHALLTQGEGSAADQVAAQQLLINQLTDAIASRYAVQGGEAGSFLLNVSGVSSLTTWHSLNQYLLSLAGVSRVVTAQVDASRAGWKLAFSGSAEQLTRLLTVNRHLSDCATADTQTPPPVTPPVPVAAASAASTEPTAIAAAVAPPVLTFCWQP